MRLAEIFIAPLKEKKMLELFKIEIFFFEKSLKLMKIFEIERNREPKKFVNINKSVWKEWHYAKIPEKQKKFLRLRKIIEIPGNPRKERTHHF